MAKKNLGNLVKPRRGKKALAERVAKKGTAGHNLFDLHTKDKATRTKTNKRKGLAVRAGTSD